MAFHWHIYTLLPPLSLCLPLLTVCLLHCTTVMVSLCFSFRCVKPSFLLQLSSFTPSSVLLPLRRGGRHFAVLIVVVLLFLSFLLVLHPYLSSSFCSSRSSYTLSSVLFIHTLSSLPSSLLLHLPPPSPSLPPTFLPHYFLPHPS